MKKKKKFILLSLIIILLSGCTIKSDVVMEPSGKVKENVTILNNSKAFKSNKYSAEQIIKSKISDYLAVLKYRNYNYNVIVNEELSGAEFTNTYKSICSYFQDTGFNQYVYPHINCEEIDNYIIIKNDTDYIPYCTDCSDWPALDNIEFRLTLPIGASENNADLVENNTYIWKYDENTSSNKSLYIKINKNELVRKNEETLKEESLKKKMNVFAYVLIIILIIGVLSSIGYILYKKYKANKLEY